MWPVRIADVSPRVVVPPRRGAAQRVYHLLRCLSERHEVRQLSQARVGDDRSPEAAGAPLYREVRHRSPVAVLLTETAERAWVRAPITAGLALRLTRPPLLADLLRWADVALVEFPWQFEQVRRAAHGRPLVYDAHNVEREKFASWAEAAGRPVTTRPWLLAIERLERAAVAHADRILVTRPDDVHAFTTRYGADPERIVLVPNGADVEGCSPVDPAARTRAKRRLGLPERPTALFVGSDMPPNRRGLDWVRRLAALRPDVTFAVVGAVSRRARSGNLIAAGRVDDVRPWLAAADVSLCPIAHGAGTKIKLLEALAAGLPTIAFGRALAGTTLQPGEHVLAVETELGSLCAALDALLEDEALRSRLARAGREAVVQRYSWRRSAERLEVALLELVESRSGAGSRPQALTARFGVA
jgi:glycosyltransferase involved in cell wall biosynthesis